MAVAGISDVSGFRSFVKESGSKLTVVHFAASWAPQCGQMNDVMKELSKDVAADVNFVQVEAEDLPEISEEFAISAVPTFIFIRNGKSVDRLDGANAAELTKKVKLLASQTDITVPEPPKPQKQISDVDSEFQGTFEGGRSRGRGRSGSRGRGRGRGSRGSRGERRGGSRGSRGSSRGRGGRSRSRGKQALEKSDKERLEELWAERKKQTKKVVGEMGGEELRELVLKLVDREPGLVFDLCEAAGEPDNTPPPPPSHGPSAPSWCKCGNCRPMATDLESKCCGCLPRNCISDRDDLDTRLKQLINAEDVMLFMKGSPAEPRCGFSRQIIQILKDNNVKFGTFNILSDEDVRQGLKTFSNWPTYPQLYAKGELLGGLDIVKELVETGELQSQLPTQVSLDDRLKGLINTGSVTLFMKGDRNTPRCGFSKQTIAILNDSGIEYKTFDILTDEEVRQGLKTFSNWPTYPQLYVKGELVGGLDIIKELQESGELETILKEGQ